MNNKFLKFFFDALNKSNIRYCVLRNYNTLPLSLGGSDLDMWVHEDDCLNFFNLTKRISNELNGHIVSYIWKRSEPKICLLGKNWGIQFDIYTGTIPIGNYELYAGELIEKHIVEYNKIKVFDNKWAAIESLLKEILNNGHCDQKEKYYNDAHEVLSNLSENELKKGLPMFSESFIKLLLRVGAEKKSKSLINAISIQGKKELKKRIKGSNLDFLLKYRRIFQRPGYMIAILGTDGAGKSSIYEAIYPHLEEAFHKGIHYRHWRPDMLPDIAELLGKRKKNERPDVCANPHAKQASGFIISMIRFLYYLQDYIFGYWFKIWPKIATKANIFIMDRYYYDYYIDQSRSRINLPFWIIRIFEYLIPKPDIIICLGGNPKVIFARKPETSLEEVTKQTQALKNFCKRNKNAFWIDTTEHSIEESAELTLTQISKSLSEKFKNIKHL